MTRTKYNKFNKLEFLIAINKICQLIFKKDVIYSLFREYRLIPYNPQITLKKIKEYLSPLSQPFTPSKNEIQIPKTPLTA